MNRCNSSCFVVSIFNGTDAHENGGFIENDFGVCWKVLGNDAHAVAVDAFGAFLFAEANNHHLAEPAFIGTTKGIVGLYAAGDDDAVGMIGNLV